jgi:acetone carboxylase alpha subunit
MTTTTTSLRSLLEASEEVFERTGHYQGIAEFDVARERPIEYERLHSRLLSTVISTRETVKYIAASPGTREIGEFVIAVYTPEGEALALSTGIMVHVHTLSEFIKFIIRNDYEDNPGIRQGDIFENNESWSGGVHTPDVQTVIPVFHEGELVAWIGSVTHELDTGSAEGAGIVFMQAERYSEGHHVSAEKIGEKDVIRADYLNRLRMNLRVPDWWIMDTKCKVAGMMMVRDALDKMFDEFGIDFYRQATRELIEEGRRSFLNQVKRSTVPGRYKSINHLVFRLADQNYVHPFGQKDMGQITPIEFTVDGSGAIDMTMEGSSRWDFHSYNCTPSGVNGALWICLVQMLAYDGKVNDGAYLAINQYLPKGSVLNTDYAGSCTSTSWYTSIPLYSNWVRLMSMGLHARGFIEEIFQGAPTNVFNAGGFDAFDRPFGVTNFETAAGSSGGRGVWDGIDHSYQLWNPEAVSGDIEIWELAIPKIYLTRSFSTDHHGMGRFRGGTSWESLFKVHNTKLLSCVLSGVEQGGTPFHKGMYGGYPGPGPSFFYAAGTNLDEHIANGDPLPQTSEDVEKWLAEGKLTSTHFQRSRGPMWTPSLKHGDLVGVRYSGGPGYGDPLDRDPRMIITDLDRGIVSAEFAFKTYGCLVSSRRGEEGTTVWEVDQEATDAERAERRRARLAGAEPVSEWWKRARRTAEAGSTEVPVVDMYKKSAMISDKVVNEYKAFWRIDSWPYEG